MIIRRILIFVFAIFCIACSQEPLNPPVRDNDARGEVDLERGDVEVRGDATADAGDMSEPPVAPVSPALPTFETHFNSPADGENDDSLEDVIIDYLGRAEPGSSVRAAFYTWSRTRVAQAFVDALEAGVDVRVIVGNTNRHADGTDWQAIQVLRG